MKQKRIAAKQTLKTDDAVSNVVVMMLILSVIVIAFSVFVGIYLPQMKETSEIMHSEDVKSAFLHLSSDMDSVYSRGQAGIYSEVFSLGGGEILLSSSKSAGTVEIRTEPLTTVNISYTNKTPIYSNGTRGDTKSGDSPEIINLNTVNVSYTPVLSYWEEQGYQYEKGVVWVQKGNGIKTPVSSVLYSIEDGNNQMNKTADSWLQMMMPAYLTENKTFTVTEEGENVTKIIENTQYIYTMTLVNVSADKNHNFLSGSGNAKLKISAELPSEITEYELSDTQLKINGKTVSLNEGALLRVTIIDAKVSVE